MQYNLISDEPIPADRDQDVKFGHIEIAQVISSLVEKATPPFTIGLFGKWGTGKTTILKQICKKLETDNIKTVEFDVWKYEHDSLRRQFLITLDKKLELGLNYKKVLNQSLSKPFELKFFESLNMNLKRFAIYGASLTIIFLLLAAVKYTNISSWLVDHKIISSKLLDAFYDFSLFSVVLSFLANSVSSVFGLVQEHRTDSAEGFEDRFYSEVLSKIDNKLLIIIDNMDRTTSEKAVALLSDIKTFLGKDENDNKAIFLIACDEEAIKKHLKNCKFDNPDEFLRKFFNASIKIPKFLGLELDQYTQELLAETGIDVFKESAELEWLLTLSFRDNPREIKQFINSLISQYLLASEMEKTKKIVTKGAITNHIEALAKLLIIRQKYANIYHQLENVVLTKIFTWNEIQEHPEQLFNDDTIAEPEKDSFVEFLQQTKHINIENLQIFVRLKQSEIEQELPGWEEFVLLAEDKKSEEAKTLFSKFNKEGKLNVLDLLLRDYLRRIKKTHANPRFFVFCSTVINSGKDHLQFLSNFNNELVLGFPTTNDLLAHFEDYSPKLIFSVIYPVVKCYNQKLLVEAYLSLFQLKDPQNKSPLSEAQATELLQTIIDKKDYFDASEDKIRLAIEEMFFEFPYLNLFTDPQSHREIITATTVQKYISTISTADLESNAFEEKLGLLSSFDTIDTQLLLDKLRELIQFESGQPARDNRGKLSKILETVLKQRSGQVSQGDSLTQISNDISVWYDQDDWNNRTNYLGAIDLLIAIPDNPGVASLEGKIRDFVNNSPFESVGLIDRSFFLNLVTKYPDEFRNSSVRDLRIYEYGKDGLPDAEVPSLITNLLDKAQDLPVDQKEPYFDVIAGLKCASDTALTNRFHSELVSLKQTLPALAKKYTNKDRGRLFNAAQKRDLKETVV